MGVLQVLEGVGPGSALKSGPNANLGNVADHVDTQSSRKGSNASISPQEWKA